MKKVAHWGLASVLAAAVMLTACSNDKQEASPPAAGTETASQAPASEQSAPASESAAGPEVTLNPDKYAGIEDTLTVKKAAITIDGSLDDWNGVDAYEVALNTDGADLKFKHNVSLAWDGDHTLFVKGTISSAGEFKSTKAQDSTEWWDDDVFELFLVTALPKDESENKGTAGHYAFGTKYPFESSELLKNATLASAPIADGVWSLEASIPLEGAYLDAVTQNASLFGKVGVELNSAGEYSLLGRKGGYWDVDNYIRFAFSPEEVVPQVALNADKFDGIADSLDVKKAAIAVDGKFDDWSGIAANEVTKNTDGGDLKYKHNVALAWDGDHTLFVKGTMTSAGEFKSAKAQDSTEWWDDDVFELFFVPALPKDESENKGTAGHYAFSTKYAFTSSELLQNATVVSAPVADGTWSFEAAVPLEGDLLDTVKAGSVFAKVGFELNSAGEYALLGRLGGFWDVDNYMILKFIQ